MYMSSTFTDVQFSVVLRLHGKKCLKGWGRGGESTRWEKRCIEKHEAPESVLTRRSIVCKERFCWSPWELNDTALYKQFLRKLPAEFQSADT